MNSRLNYFVIYPPLIFFEERSTAFRSAEKQKNRKTPNGNSIGGFLFTFTRERVSRRNHNARSKTPPNFLGRIATPFQTKRNFQNVSKRRRREARHQGFFWSSIAARIHLCRTVRK